MYKIKLMLTAEVEEEEARIIARIYRLWFFFFIASGL